MTENLIFSRKDLAQELVVEMIGEGGGFGRVVSNPGAGSFLSAKRRTGKSTFLRNDLVPALTAKNIPAIYVDLWADRATNPSDLIARGIQTELERQSGFIMKKARAAGMTKVAVAGVFTFDVAKIGTTVTLAAALQELVDRHPAGRVALIIDEAQHALSTDEGQSVMFALKSARDALNVGMNPPKLLLLCTGSSRSKLGSLVTGKESPFYGARIRDFPMLDRAFSDFLVDRLRMKLQADLAATVDKSKLFSAFEILGRRPEEMINVISDAVFKLVGDDINSNIIARAQERRDEYIQELGQQFNALPPIQQAILLRLIRLGDSFSPYDADAMENYRKYVGDGELTTTNVQYALDGLVSREIVWRPKRGGYFIDDPMWNDWEESRESLRQKANATPGM